MPVRVERRDGKYRIVEISTGDIASTEKGNAVDGGGHDDKLTATRQAAAINKAVYG